MRRSPGHVASEQERRRCQVLLDGQGGGLGSRLAYELEVTNQ